MTPLLAFSALEVLPDLGNPIAEFHPHFFESDSLGEVQLIFEVVVPAEVVEPSIADALAKNAALGLETDETHFLIIPPDF